MLFTLTLLCAPPSPPYRISFSFMSALLFVLLICTPYSPEVVLFELVNGIYFFSTIPDVSPYQEYSADVAKCRRIHPRCTYLCLLEPQCRFLFHNVQMHRACHTLPDRPHPLGSSDRVTLVPIPHCPYRLIE